MTNKQMGGDLSQLQKSIENCHPIPPADMKMHFNALLAEFCYLRMRYYGVSLCLFFQRGPKTLPADGGEDPVLIVYKDPIIESSAEPQITEDFL